MPSKTPSIKGLLLIGAVVPVRRAIREGSLAREVAEARIPGEHWTYLDPETKLEPTRWYPVDAMSSYLELCISQTQAPRDESLRALGRAGAEQARSTGLYPQLDFERGKLAGASKQEGEAFARLLASSWGAFYDFGTWKHGRSDRDDLLYTVDLLGAAALPEVLRPASESFMLTVLEWAWGSALRSITTRLADDHTRFEIVRGVPLEGGTSPGSS